jgi:hypothetical protein
MSPKFVNYVYLKCQLNLDTFHHLIAPCILVGMVLLTWTMMTWDLNVCAMCITR